MRNRHMAAAGLLLLFGASACADLVVENENTPDRGRALATPGDVEALVAGGYRSWFGGEEWESSINGSPAFFLGTQSFMFSSTAANLGSHEYSKLPRTPIQNTSTHAEYEYTANAWTRHYRALASVADGLRTIQSDTTVANALGADRVLRARIFAKLVQGLAHGSLALIYDQGYLVDESVMTIDDKGAPVDLGTPLPYNQLMTAALAKLDTVILLAGTAPSSVTIPREWTGTPAVVTMPEIARVARSFKARYRANVARTAAERTAVNWAAVLAETGAGITTDYQSDRALVYPGWTNSGVLAYMQSPTFQQLTYFIHGMADQGGDYQKWLAQPVVARTPDLDGQPVLIRTPDLRFPQGSTLAEQMANKGKYYHIRTTAAGALNISSQWTQANRGTWRHSYYSSRTLDPSAFSAGAYPEIARTEMRMLAAEAHFRLGNLAAAADSINVSRTANGLNATNAAGLNTSCVPKLPSGACGGLFEMLKWEKRNETWGKGPYKASWYFDGRGWGDLYRGTPLQLPIPEEQIVVLGLGPSYTFGGIGGPSSSPGSSYAFPGE